MPSNPRPKNETGKTPYENFRFKLKWDVGGTTAYVAGVSKISGLKRTIDVKQDPNRTMPGLRSFEAITLERGLSDNAEFVKWATNSASKILRQNMSIEVCNEDGQIVLTYNLFNCWVSEFQAMPELDATAHGVLIESITLRNEGWERDDRVKDEG